MRKKRLRVAQNAQAPNLIEEGKSLYLTIKDTWHSYFGNNNPMTLELGCGRGDYTLALAKNHPNQNFIGIDIKGPRLWTGSQQALNLSLHNVAFLRTDINLLTRFFQNNQITALYITFPDPYPRPRDTKRRLVSPRFLEQYQQILVPRGRIHLKTDHHGLFTYAINTLDKSVFSIEQAIEDIYHHLSPTSIHTTIQTTYEKRFIQQGLPIHYLSACLIPPAT